MLSNKKAILMLTKVLWATNYVRSGKIWFYFISFETMAGETTVLPPPTYNNVILENMLSWNLPDDIVEAIDSLLHRPLKPPEHPYR